MSAAKKHGFSLKILRLSLAAYRIARTIGVDEVYSGTVTANCGITAGSGFATTELRVLLTDLLYDLRRLWPASLKLYVDDLTIAAKGEPAHVARVLSEATDYAVNTFTKLGLKVSKSKSNAVASSNALRRTIVIKTRTMALRPVKHAKLLGVGLAGGKKRTIKVQSKRLDAFASKIRRIQAIRRQGVSAVQYVQAAGVPAMLYGVECTGIADTSLKHALVEWTGCRGHYTARQRQECQTIHAGVSTCMHLRRSLICRPCCADQNVGYRILGIMG